MADTGAAASNPELVMAERAGSLESLELNGGPEAAQEVASDAWKKTLDAVVPAVVVLKVTQTRSFDTEPAGSSYATGFVVDKARGLILTNRHVVTPGPVVAEAIFLNREEVPVQPLYYDPVHDFGFMRFDPARLQYMQPAEVPLAPQAAEVGLEIRVVGNDSGEKISILSGTLARLDRDAPHYTRKGFNDFNTFYLQAASGTKGGSSGSPVINVRGQAVGLNAGGKNKAASAYYLPLHRVVRALRLLQACHKADGSCEQPHIPRGDLQATFVFKGYDEVRRLGLQQDTEAAVRASKQQHDDGGSMLRERPGSTGMLVVESVVPGGPADGQLEPGDVLVRLNGQIVTEFLTMEAMLDDSVGGTVKVEVERGGVPLAADILVQDLHAVTPSRLLDLGGGSLNELSYQQARNNRAAVGQVYVAEPGYLLGKAGVAKYAIITALAGSPTPSLAAFVEALKGLRHGQRVPLEFFTFGERHRRKSTILHVNWSWYGPPLVWTRNNAAGIWDCRVELPHSLAASPQAAPGGAAAASAEAAHAAPAATGAGPASNGKAAKRPPLPPGAAGAAAPSPGQGAAAPAGTGIPRLRSVPAIPVHEDVEKQQPGVTAQADDARLLHSPAAEAAAEVGVGPASAPAAAAADANSWRLLLEEQLRCGLVLVDVEIPLVALADGVHSRSFSGCGMIVHQSDALGLVVVDRNTVTIGCGDVMLSFGAFPAEVSARVRFLHPLHNFSILSYDPRQLSEEARRLIRPLRLSPSPPLRRGDAVELVCLSKSLRILHRTSSVTNPAMSVLIHKAEVPRFRAVHEEVVKLDQDFGLAYSGVLCDRSGGVRALWGSYSEQVSKEESEWTAGLPSAIFAPWVETLIEEHQAQRAQQPGDPSLPAGEAASAAAADAAAADAAAAAGSSGGAEEAGVVLPPPAVVTLDAELEPLLLSKAAQFGLPTEWISRLVRLDPERRQVLRVHSCVAGSHAQQVLKDADMVLAINSQPVSSYNDVERIIASAAALAAAGGPAVADPPAAPTEAAAGAAASAAGAGEALAEVSLTIFREGVVQEVSVRLGREDGLGTNQLVHWCGAQLQYPHRGVRELGFLPERHGVYISRWHHGSPAHRYGLYALHWVSEVNGQPTPDLDAFLAVVRQLPDGADVRVRLVHFESSKSKVLTLKTDQRYWPTWKLQLDPARAEWTRVPMSSAA
ncbi:hypothetical protein ABPG75_010420 [Micractinium tetrahymenae]